MRVDVCKQLVRVFGNLEEVRLLSDLLHRTPAVRAFAVNELMLRPVAFTRCTVKSLIGSLVDIALGIDAAENLLHDLFMTRLGRANEIIIRYIQAFPEVLETGYNAVNILDRRNALFLRLALDFLSMLITAGQKEYIITSQTLETCNGVRYSCTIGMPDMQLGTRIINRCRYVE